MALPSNVPRHSKDFAVEKTIDELRIAIRIWAESHDLWYDCGFHDYVSHVDGEPSSSLPVVTIMWFEGPLHTVFSGEDPENMQEEFQELLESLGYWFENKDGTSIEIYPDEESDFSDFLSYFHWKWVCSLIQDDFSDVYNEIYLHFSKNPEDLKNLHWRDFEILLSRTFQAQGFKVELGPGRGDEGVDISLLQRDPLGDVLTLVQAKRYSPHRQIDLQAVSSLYGIGVAAKANKTLFVTTSTYAPVARRWASRVSDNLSLATSSEVAEWCASANEGVISDKSKLVTLDHVQSILKSSELTKGSLIVHAQHGYNMILNKFALILKETNHAALLMSLGRRTISGDGYGQEGNEVPIIDYDLNSFNKEGVWRAKRRNKDGDISYWDGTNYFTKWDGNPKFFSWLD